MFQDSIVGGTVQPPKQARVSSYPPNSPPKTSGAVATKQAPKSKPLQETGIFDDDEDVQDVISISSKEESSSDLEDDGDVDMEDDDGEEF